MSRRSRFLILAILVVLVALVVPALQRFVAQAEEGSQAPAPVAVEASHFAISPPISELPPVDEVKVDVIEDKEIKSRPPKQFRPAAVDAGPGSIDGALQPPGNRPQGAAPQETAIPAPIVSFDGVSQADNFALFGTGVLPPDTDGDVGPNHYVLIVNDVYRIYDKTGAPLIPARKISSIFAALGTACATSDDGDPIVLYDPLADRWLISQFCTLATPNNHQLIAISRTGDPTGSYFLYDFMMPNNKFNDYPKFGVWPDGYYMTDNQFNQAGTQFLGGGVFAFDRAKMLVGDPTASYIYFDLFGLNPNLGGMLPSDMDGLNPPPAGAPNYFMYYTADEFGDPSDALRIFEFHADFGTPALSTFTERPESPLLVPAFDPRNPSGRNDIEQPAPGVNLDSIQDRLLFRLAYRNFGGQEGLVVNQTVNVGAAPTTSAGHQAAIRYYQLRRALPGGAFTLLDRATYAPDTDNRWMGSAAEDNQGNLAVGYSVSSTVTFPSVRYAGRLASDPPNGLFQGENSIVAGTGVQRHTSGRWGDYSDMSVDPSDDCTFWYTQEYYTAASQLLSTASWLTRVGSFKFASCTPAAKGTIQGTAYNALTSLPIAGVLVQADAYSRVTGAGGTYSMDTVPGTYNMTASFPGYLSDSASGVVVVDGATTTQDFFLTPIPIIQSAGTSNVTGESCSPSTGGLDPGETVTVDLAVRNTGAADTLGLVGTLLPGGGVTSPSGPQSYGVVLAGGVAVARSFTFTVDSSLGCGDTLTASLHLQDGGSDLGTVTYAFTLGTFSNGTFPASYSSGDIAVAIPDVSSVDIPIPVPTAGVVGDVNVRVRLDHTFDMDLIISLIHPDGTAVILSNRRGGGGDNFGTGANDCSGTHTVFDDSGAVAISAGTAPFAGTFRPDQLLSGLNGKPTSGTWKLRVADVAGTDTGTVGCVQLEIASRVPLCCPFAGGSPAVQAAPPATIVSEGCSPADGAVDPNETVSVSFPLQNFGTGATTNLVATLLPGGGVTSPGPDQTYGAVNPIGPPVARTFTFVAQGTCGGSVQATLHLQDGPDDLGNVTFTLSLGNFVPSFPQNFDGVSAPALPAGWTAAVSGTTPPPAWATTTAAGFFVSAPNGAATGSSATLSESRLDSETIAVPPALSARLSFQNNYNLESTFDGGVLEISIGGGAFLDILAAGGSFVAGGYNGTISTGSGIAGRQAWTGTSGGFIVTTVNLPAGALGQNIRLRWRAAFDTSISVTNGGWRIDDVAVSTFQCCGPVVLAAPPATVTSESCGPANSAPDPDETVSVSFPLRNTGTANTSDLVATLLSGGGVNSPGGPQNYGVVMAGGAPVARSFSFVPSGTCGGNITATLHLQDGTFDLGNVTFTIQLGTIASATTSFTNAGSITIPAVGTVGTGTPYPSTIAVSGVSGPVSKVTVTLFGINHTFPDDIDILLVGPGGDKFIIMSDAGGGVDLVNTTITLDDSAAALLPNSTLIASGTFRPSNYGTGDTFAAPAPPAPYQTPATSGTATFASVFNGKNPNGTWSLYVVDAFSGDSGNISGGWQISITTSQPVCCSQACTLTCPSDIVTANDAGLCGAVVGYPAFGVSGSCGVVAGNPPSGSFFPVGGTTVLGTGTSTSDGVVGSCSFMVTVNDTEAPVLTVSLDPDLLWPPNHRLVDTTATVTAVDNCGSATVVLDSITSNEPDNAPGNGDGNTDNDIQDADYGTADFLFVLRAERTAGGQGRVYTATYSAVDPSGNSSSASGTSFVPHDQDGTDDPLSLALSDSAFGTVLSWNQVNGAQHYSVIRGQLSGIHEQVNFIDLGAVSCMAVGTHAINTIGQEDTEVPAVGEVFFYAVAYNNNGASSSYGAASAAKPRVTGSGGCE